MSFVSVVKGKITAFVKTRFGHAVEHAFVGGVSAAIGIIFAHMAAGTGIHMADWKAAFAAGSAAVMSGLYTAVKDSLK